MFMMHIRSRKRGAARLFRIGALSCCLLAGSGSGLLANPSSNLLAEKPVAKADRLAVASPPPFVGEPTPFFVTVARPHGRAVTVLEKVAVAH